MMPDEIGILQEMIRETAVIPIEEDSYGRRRRVTLGEPGDEKRRGVTITGLPNDAIVIDADAFPATDKVFRGSKGENKRADFIIVANMDGKRVILCIEMKARKTLSKTDNKGIIRQLNGTWCLIGYFREIGRLFWQSPEFLDDCEPRFIRIALHNTPKKETRAKKKPTDQSPSRHSPKTEEIHDSAERSLRVKASVHDPLLFNRLV